MKLIALSEYWAYADLNEVHKFFRCSSEEAYRYSHLYHNHLGLPSEQWHEAGTFLTERKTLRKVCICCYERIPEEIRFVLKLMRE